MTFKSYKMNKILTILTLFLLINHVNAQNKTSDVFKKSYSFEAVYAYDKAAQSLEKIYNSNVDNYEINLRLGWLNYLNGDLKKSIQYYSKAHNLKPMSLEAIYGIILPLIVQQDYNSVINYAKKALSVVPKDTRAEYYMGLSYYYKKDYLKAENYLEKAINKHPFDLDINLMLGWTKFALGKKNEAKALFLVAQKNSPDNINVKAAIDLISK